MTTHPVNNDQSDPNAPAVSIEVDVIPEAEPETEEDTSLQDEEILRVARERFTLSEEAFSEIRNTALEDMKFRVGEQWPDNIKQIRNMEGRPCLTINRLPQFIQQVTNDQRQNRPAIKVHPLSDGANQDTAKIIQGLIRHIEYNSSAEAAYDTAFEHACTNGFGFFRIVTAFSDPESFNQEILFKRIRDPLSVYMDPYSEEPDGSDAKWCFITEDLPQEEYKVLYPESKMGAPGFDWSATGNHPPGWIKGDSARVAEYFYIEMKEERIHLLKTGQTVRDHELQDQMMHAHQAGLDASLVSSRVTKIPIVHWMKINGIEILERTVFPGTYIPIIPTYGAEVYMDGQRYLESVIRHAKDAQRMYNYWKSAETETIALAPRTPFIAAEGQLEGFEAAWQTANTKNHAFLYYKPTTIAGQQVPPPQRQAVEPATQAITQASMQAADDLKATTGVYDAALGQQSPDSSGLAIQRRANQTQTSNFHFVDNLHRAMKHAGRILVDIIPYIYDTARTARIIGEDGAQKLVRVNEQTEGDDGKQKIYDLDVGKYGVSIDAGPSFASKRQEAVSAMADITRAYPQLMQTCGDLMIKNMDWPGADEMANRIRMTLPPQLQADPKKMQIPPQIQAQMQQMSGMVQQLSQKLNETTKIIETKKLELEHKERIEAWNLQFQQEKLKVETEVQLAKLGTQSSIALLEQEIGALKHESGLMNDRLRLLKVDQPIEAPNDFNPQQADGGSFAGAGHVGSGPTGGPSPGTPMEQ